MQGIDSTTAPLGANQSFFGRWIDVSGSGDAPMVAVSTLADQAGTIQVLESHNPTDAAQVTVAGGVLAGAGNPADLMVQVRKRFCQAIYINGPTAQTSFSLTARKYSPSTSSSDSRLFDLILRELRITNLLLMQMREPYQSTMNIRPSLDQLES